MTALSAAAASNAMRNLQLINRDMTATQNRISTGLKVASARDDASVWVAATSIRADIKQQDVVSSNLTIAKGRADITVQAVDKLTEVIGKMKLLTDKLVDHANTAAGDATNDAKVAANAAIGEQLKPLQAQLKAIIGSGSFEGANWLTSETATKLVLSTDDGVNVTYDYTPTLKANQAGSKLKALVDYTPAAVGTALNASTDKKILTDALTLVQSFGTEVQGLSDTIDLQLDFANQMNAIRQTALGRLVDADMTVESAKLSALQVREQLTYQALAITNSSQQNILRLFQ